MKLKFFLFLMLLAPSAAFAHLVNYDSKAYLDIAKGNQERANYIAHFCSLAATSVDDCMARLLVAKGEVAAEKCGREIIEIGVEMQKEMHALNVRPGKPDSGVEHTNILCTKDEGCHKVGFTDGTRGLAGERSGTEAIRMAREQAVKLQEIKNDATEKTGTFAGALKIIGKIFGSGTETTVTATGEYKDVEGKSVVRGGLDQHEIAKAYNIGFKWGWENPVTAGISPDIYCSDKIKGCTANDGRKYNMTDDFTITPPIPKDRLKGEGPVSVDKSKDNGTKDDGPAQPDSPNASFDKSKDLFKSGASINASTNSDSSWARIQQSDSGELTPIQACYELEMYKIKKKEAVKNVDGDELAYAQQKEKAESNLQLGFCDESFYGRDFCADWKFKQSLNVDETLSSDPIKSEQAFEEISSWEKPDTAPILNVDPSCNPICPIEAQPH